MSSEQASPEEIITDAFNEQTRRNTGTPIQAPGVGDAGLEPLLQAFPSGPSKIAAHLPTYDEARDAIRAHVNGLKEKLNASYERYNRLFAGRDENLAAERQKCARLREACAAALSRLENQLLDTSLFSDIKQQLAAALREKG